MKVGIAFICVFIAVPVLAQNTPAIQLAPEYSDNHPRAVPDVGDWEEIATIQEVPKLVWNRKWTPFFLQVLEPEGVCSRKALPCQTALRFSFWRETDIEKPRHVGRFIIESRGRLVEGIAMKDVDETFWYWVKRAGLWMPVEKDTELYQAHDQFYSLLQLLLNQKILIHMLEELRETPGASPSKTKKLIG